MIAVERIRNRGASHAYEQDLDGAFNDGYRLKAQTRGDHWLTWVFFGWCALAWAIGTFVIIDVVVTSLAGLGSRLMGWIY